MALSKVRLMTVLVLFSSLLLAHRGWSGTFEEAVQQAEAFGRHLADFKGCNIDGQKVEAAFSTYLDVVAHSKTERADLASRLEKAKEEWFNLTVKDLRSKKPQAVEYCTMLRKEGSSSMLRHIEKHTAAVLDQHFAQEYQHADFRDALDNIKRFAIFAGRAQACNINTQKYEAVVHEYIAMAYDHKLGIGTLPSKFKEFTESERQHALRYSKIRDANECKDNMERYPLMITMVRKRTEEANASAKQPLAQQPPAQSAKSGKK